ncbi:MAG: YerC/YecD family TrpR-related protein [Acholeplasmataceae bacterium]|nr:YerC/YecD family TrpR-related protein [Acholeplasmataceae bacterium]MDD4194023.1 YerC/YecD family TrpR-related protein [Acholeplasmataceae bacterium]
MYKSKFANQDIDDLYEAILTLDSVEECYRFFEDLCTVKEIFDMAQRLKVAKMLVDKKPYLEITHETKASTATISRVNKSLIYGAEGYHLYFKKKK